MYLDEQIQQQCQWVVIQRCIEVQSLENHVLRPMLRRNNLTFRKISNLFFVVVALCVENSLSAEKQSRKALYWKSIWEEINMKYEFIAYKQRMPN